MSLEAKDLLTITHYEYGEAFFGSLGAMRFRAAREPMADVHHMQPEERGEAALLVTTWPDPDSFRTAPEASKRSADFPFTQEGLEQAADWLNRMYESGEWKPGGA